MTYGINASMDYIVGLSRFVIPFPPKEQKTIVSSVFPKTFAPDMLIVRLAGISGALAVTLGAYGAHGLREKSGISKHRIQSFETGNRYHLLHTFAMLGALRARFPTLTASLFLAGISLFSGTIYVYSMTGNEQVRRYTPLGGMLFIIGWLSMIL